MAPPRSSLRLRLAVVAGVVLAFLAVAADVWRDDIVKALLDPKAPFGKDHPAAAPDYAQRGAWALTPDAASAGQSPVDVFFVHPTSYPASFTSYNGQRHWNGPIHDHGAMVALDRVMLPNYAGPFASVGDVYVPRYRQASLYTKSTLWDDAIDARRFAYGDVKAAFDYYRDHASRGRPFILVGVEQGGELGARLLREEIAPDPKVRGRLV